MNKMLLKRIGSFVAAALVATWFTLTVGCESNHGVGGHDHSAHSQKAQNGHASSAHPQKAQREHDHSAHAGKPHSMPTPAKPATVAIKPYPSSTCVVSGKKLGSMGKPARIVHKGQEIKFCCGGCIKGFKNDPAIYMLFVSDAGAKPYPFSTCLVTGEMLGPLDGAIRFVHMGQEIYICCTDCERDFFRNPNKYMKKIAEAGK